MVAAAHPLAAQAGLAVLRAGGNAADAALATAATLVVVEPNMSHLGGDAFIQYYDARRRTTVAINASGPAPQAATLDIYHDGIPPRGIRAATVPGIVDGWLTLHERFATRPLDELFAAAIGYAEDGFPVSARLAAYTAAAQDLLAQTPAAAAQFMPAGRPPRPGEILRQPAVGRTLRAIAAGGRAAYNHGPLAEAFVRAARELGGLFTLDDLAAQRAEVLAPLVSAYRGYDVSEQPPVSQGFLVLATLGIAEQTDLAHHAPCSAASVHLLVEAYKLALADRLAYAGDPAHTGWSVAPLLNRDYLARRAAQIDPRRARAHAAGQPSGGDTTYFCAIDRDGNAVSFIQSLYFSFGSGVVLGDTGILLNNRLTGFNTQPGHPNCLAPGKRPIHTLNTYLVFRDGRLRLLGGTRGAFLQVQTNAQIISHVLDHGMTLQEAMEAPRWGTQDGVRLEIESRAPAETVAGLRERGHEVHLAPAWWDGCTAHLIGIDEQSGAYLGAGDPRAESHVAAW
jgi:gamma-glutamyltranspeptidase/glutathione hydrolase